MKKMILLQTTNYAGHKSNRVKTAHVTVVDALRKAVDLLGSPKGELARASARELLEASAEKRSELLNSNTGVQIQYTSGTAFMHEVEVYS